MPEGQSSYIADIIYPPVTDNPSNENFDNGRKGCEKTKGREQAEREQREK